MFVYLSKKIAIPNGLRVHSISWNKEKGWIACGGEQGLLKVLRLEATSPGSQQTRDAKARGLAAPSNLTMNQPLEGHNGAVVGVVAWNEPFQRLTSSDQNGLIIVWTLHDGNWIEEMLNNRGKSLVRDMHWNSDGQKICIIYEDGAVIVGSVDGNRIWGKELKGMQLHKVAWSPDSKKILFGTATGEIHAYDYHGSPIGRVAAQCLNNISAPATLAAIRWYHPRASRAGAGSDTQSPALAICFQNGRVQLMQSDQDPAPILLDTGMRLTDVAWSCDGSTLALAGSLRIVGQEKEMNAAVFYSAFGEHLRTLKVPGRDLSSISWEDYSLRIALAVDSFIYFANIRPSYEWCYFANTLCYAYSKPGRSDTAVIFWNLHSGEKHLKYVKSLLSLRGCGEFCLLVARAEQQNKQQYIAVICNSIGTPMDSNYLDIQPLFLHMSGTHVFAANRTGVYSWQYRASQTAREFTSASQARRFDNRERVFHVDDLAPGTGVSRSKQGDEEGSGGVDFSTALADTADPICAICASEKALVVARESGLMQRYFLPKLSLEKKFHLSSRAHSLALNCSSTKLSIIDTNAVLSIFDFSQPGPDGSLGLQLPFEVERKDVWHLCWASDNSDLFACMEKTRMYIIRGVDAEEPVASSGYICEFSNLQVRSGHMDEIMKNPDNPQDICTSVHEVKSLRDCRELIKKVAIDDCFRFVDKNPHPRLWHLLAEQALEQLEMDLAEKAFVRGTDYQGIQFLKRLRRLDSQPKQRAEVAAYFSRFDEAEKLYLEIDRKDLALELRMKLGDWFRVVQLLRTAGGAGNDAMLERAWNAIGDYFAERQKWQQAVTYYVQAQNHEKLVHCYQILENYSGLEGLLATLPDGHALLSRLGEIFLNAGMAEQCLRANLRCNNVKAAVNACVRLNQWDRAVELAKTHSFPEIDSLLLRYVSRLLEEGKLLEAVELYRKSNRSVEGAELLQRVCLEQQTQGASPLRLKKMHVLKALLVREHQERLKSLSQQKKGQNTPQLSLEGLLHHDVTAGQTNFIERAWHGAEAYHFFLLAQRQLYQQKYLDAMVTAVQLQSYDDILPPRAVYSLLALTAAMSHSFAVCSRAFCKLETIPGLGEELQQQIQGLAMEIFTRFSVRDERPRTHTCYSCESAIPCHSGACPSCETKFPISVLTGRPLMAEEGVVWFCGVCKHKAEETIEDSLQFCPLCHSPID